jgi:hypothetical protein
VTTPPYPGQSGDDPQQQQGYQSGQQPGYGQQQQPGYGQQQGYGQQGYPSAPPIAEQATGPAPQQPTTILVSFWCWIVAAVLGLVGALILFGEKGSLNAAAQSRLATSGNTDITPTQVSAVVNGIIVGALVAAIIVGALYVLFAFKLKQGRNWARIVLLIIAILDVLSLLVNGGGTGVLGWIGVVVAVVGAVTSFLTPSSQYIAAVKAQRQIR